MVLSGRGFSQIWCELSVLEESFVRCFPHPQKSTLFYPYFSPQNTLIFDPPKYPHFYPYFHLSKNTLFLPLPEISRNSCFRTISISTYFLHPHFFLLIFLYMKQYLHYVKFCSFLKTRKNPPDKNQADF